MTRYHEVTMDHDHDDASRDARLGESFLDDLQRWWMNLMPHRRIERSLDRARAISAERVAAVAIERQRPDDPVDSQ